MEVFERSARYSTLLLWQIKDTLDFSGKSFSLCAYENGQAFDPAAHGLRVASKLAGCWRGHYCELAISGSQLQLENLFVYLSGPEQELAEQGELRCFGQVPLRKRIESKRFSIKSMQFERTSYWSPWYFEGLALPLSYSGRILLGADATAYNPHKARDFKDMRELQFIDGQLILAADRAELTDQAQNDTQVPILKSLKQRKVVLNWRKSSDRAA